MGYTDTLALKGIMLTLTAILLLAVPACFALPINDDREEGQTIQLSSGRSVILIHLSRVRLCDDNRCSASSFLTSTSRYFGHHDEEAGVTAYYAIPYARAARFELPAPIDEVDGLDPDVIVNATQHGPACINFNLPPPYDKGFETLLGDEPIEPQSEDCLTMDVFVPDGGHEDLPVYCKHCDRLLIHWPNFSHNQQSTHQAAASS